MPVIVCSFCGNTLSQNNEFIIGCECHESIQAEYVEKERKKAWLRDRQEIINLSKTKNKRN